MIFNRAWTEEHRVIERFSEAMKEELDSNLLKGDRDQWSQVGVADLLTEIDHHKEKLMKALHAFDFPKILEHSADVANIAMMIADNTGCLGNDSPRFYLREKQRNEEEARGHPPQSKGQVVQWTGKQHSQIS